MTRMKLIAPCGAGVAAFACAALACEVHVIYSEAPGHPTAIVPGAVGLDGKPIVTEFKALEVLTVGPGSRWIIRGRNHAGSDLETMVLFGEGMSGAVIAQEGQPVHDGQPGEVYDFFGASGADFDNFGRFVFAARARGGDAAVAHKGIYYDLVQFHLVRQQGDAALGLVDLPPNPSGDELFGNSFGSIHLLSGGIVGCHDTTIQNIHSSRRPAVFYGDTAFMQVGVTPIAGGLWDGMDLDGFWTTPDGATFVIRGDDDGPDAQDDILVVGSAVAGAGAGTVVLREGTAIGGSGIIVVEIFHTKLADDGTWFSRGDDPADNDWAVRNGELIAASGEPIAPDLEEHWAEQFYAFNGNESGMWVLSGKTDNPDPATDTVLVFKGFGPAQIVLREGDPVDLDGNGSFDDDAFVGRGNNTLNPFHPDDLFLSNAVQIYTFVSLRNAAGQDLGTFGTGGDAFLLIEPFGNACPGDVDGCGTVDVQDLVIVITEWGLCPPEPCPADIDDDGQVGVGDMVIVILNWGGCV